MQYLISDDTRRDQGYIYEGYIRCIRLYKGVKVIYMRGIRDV